MSIKRILLFIILVFLAFLALYTWNSRTHSLDEVTNHTGLEITGGILKSSDGVLSAVHSLWKNYISLVDVRQENEELKKQITEMQRQINTFAETKAELKRLYTFFAMDAPPEWERTVTRVLSGKLGAFSSLETIIVDKGYLSGAVQGRPLMTDKFLVGRIYQAGPTTSMALLIEDLGSRVAVIAGKTRLQGILSGAGKNKLLEVRFIGQDVQLFPGEILYTSGLDNAFPKGIAIAKVSSIPPILSTSFQVYYAEPLADFTKLEELVLLIPPLGFERGESSPVLSTIPLEDELEMELQP